MKRTVRLLAAPAVALVFLSACSGGTDEASPVDTSPIEQAPGGDSEAAESDSWPIVEDEDGNVVENPEDEPMDDGGDDAMYVEGNETSVEFDGESMELDMESMLEGTWSPDSRYYAEGVDGAKYLIEFDAEGPDDLEAYREKTGTGPVSYVRIDIDNTAGTTDAGAGNLVVVDANGQEYDYETAFIAMDEWGPSMYDDGPADENDGYYYALADGTKIPEEEYTPLQNEGVELYNELLDTAASPRAKQTIWLIGSETPDTMAYFGLDDGMEPLYGMPLL